MKNQLQKSWRVSLLFAALLLASYTEVEAQTITQNQTGTHNGFYYSFWNQGGGGATSMTLGAAGNYSTSWSNVSNFTAGKGWATGSPTRVINFSGNFNGGSNGFLAVYGWTTNALIEYYVVENYGNWTPPGGQSIGTVNSDGGTYNIYRMHRTDAPCIIGDHCDFDQYWSVRTSKRSSGTVTFANHVAAWQSKGMVLGSTWNYQIMETEGYQSSGSSNITVSEGTNPNPNPNPGSKTIVVRARGTSGSESIQLQVNNATIATWTLTTSMSNYTATTTTSGGINVRFTNDASNRDVQVDYIQVNGSTRQAEAQTSNTGVYQNGTCGGSNSEWMHCNGYIGFGNTPSARIASDVVDDVDDVTAEVSRANGIRVYPNPISNGKFTIDLAGLEGAHYVAFTDLYGKILRDKQLENQSSVDLEVNAPSGIYLVRVKGSKRQEVRKISIK